MKLLRSILYPAACFTLAWGAAHLIRLMSAVGDDTRARPSITPLTPAAKSPRGERMATLRAAFTAAKPGEWSALWHEFAAKAGIADLKDASLQAAPVLPQLAAEELAVRTGTASGNAGAFAALASRDAAAALKLAKRTGVTAYQCAVLRVMAQSDPATAVSLARRMPAGRPLSVDEENDLGRSGETDTPPGAVFSAWTRRDPQAAAAAAETLGAKAGHVARRQIVRQWACRDGPAALRYLAEQVPPGSEMADAVRMDYILRAAIFSDPAGTAKMLREVPALRDAFSGEGAELRAVRPWYLADPQTAVAWLHSPAGQGRGAMWLINFVAPGNPAAALHLVREFPKAGFPDHARNLALIAESEPAAALALADELGLRPKVEAELRLAEIKADPATACDRWLAAVQKHGADDSLAALGWTRWHALQLAAFASHALPDKARALAAVVPAARLMPEKRLASSERAALKFWPDLQRETNPSPSPSAKVPPDPTAPLPFAANPAAAAEALLSRPLLEADAEKAVNCWAPHDFPAAQSWVARLPDGPARRKAALALAHEQARHDPAAALAAATSGRFMAPPEFYAHCLQRLARTGGDWRQWIARTPAEALPHRNRSLPDILEEESNILTAVRNAVR